MENKTCTQRKDSPREAGRQRDSCTASTEISPRTGGLSRRGKREEDEMAEEAKADVYISLKHVQATSLAVSASGPRRMHTARNGLASHHSPFAMWSRTTSQGSEHAAMDRMADGSLGPGDAGWNELSAVRRAKKQYPPRTKKKQKLHIWLLILIHPTGQTRR